MMNNTILEAEYGRCKTSVWWDIENCAVPKGCDAHGIAQRLSSALMNLNYCGPLSISSYGNTDLIPKAVQHALSSTGISLNHVPSGRKDASDKKILVDMFLWVVENPPPANIMLISGDIDFSDALHRLRMRRYNILLAHPQRTSPSLVASATTSWLWRSLLASGSSLTPCESSCEDVSEHVLSTQPVDSGSGSVKDARNKLKGIYVPKAPNQLLVKETKGKKLQKECSESVQNNDKESLKCLEKQNKKMMETITTCERSVRDFSLKERLDRDDVAPLNVDHVFNELSRGFQGTKEVSGESFDAIPMKVEPTQNEIVIKELEDMLKQVLQIMPSEQENALASLSENLKEDINKRNKRKKKKSRVIEDKAEPYVCSICSVIYDSPAIFESHLSGRKHAAAIENHAAVQEDTIQDNGHLIDVTEEIQFKPREAAEIIEEEIRERYGIYEWSVGEFSQAFEEVLVLENGCKPLPNEECNFNELNAEFWSPKEAREWIDAMFNTPDLSQDAHLSCEFESLKMNSGDTENAEKYMDMMEKDKVSKDKAEPEAHVCSICSVVCVCPIVFESHLMGRRHATKVLFDDKKILEESLKEKHHPSDAQESIKEVSQSSKEGAENESEQEPKETRERLHLVEEKNVKCTSQMDFYSHMKGKKHVATVKKHEPAVKKQAGTKFAYVRKNGP